MKNNYKIDYLNKKKIKKIKNNNKIYPGFLAVISNVILDKEHLLLKKFHGICLRKKNKGIMSSILIRNVVKNNIIEKNYYIHHPFLFNILTLKKKNYRKSKLFFLRKQSRKRSKSRFK